MLSRVLPLAAALTGAAGFRSQLSGGSLGNGSAALESRGYGDYEVWVPTPTPCSAAERCHVYVSDAAGKDDKSWGASPDRPYKTLQFAVDRRIEGQTIHVMAGTYRNRNFGTGSKNNGPVLRLDGVSDLTIRGYQDDRPVIEFDGAGGFLGGSAKRPVVNVEFAQLEIKGPNAEISYEEAMGNRLIGDAYFGGRGLGIWNGHHIHIHDMLVHHCPNSGIRVNNADYVIIENSEVYATTWWSPNAESAIVLATAVNIDEKDMFKMIMRNNRVYDNMNKIPYYNSKYRWDYSPIGSAKCSEYKECEQELMSCPWTCRYGKKTQDYIIDGQGVYVTRNAETYLHGRMELSGNTCFRNGINGVVFHRTNRGLVKDNVVFDNGRVPKAGHPEEHPEDWHQGCSGKSRQPYSGLILNEAEDVEVVNNKVAARYSDDYAYRMQMDHGSAFPVEGDGNRVCLGTGELTPDSVLTRPQRCADTKTQWMVDNGRDCASSQWLLSKYCSKSEQWAANRYCEYSCFKAGLGYEASDCCELEDRPSGWMVQNGKDCATWTGGIQNNCNANDEWVENRWCQLSCFLAGRGYDGDNCCAIGE